MLKTLVFNRSITLLYGVSFLTRRYRVIVDREKCIACGVAPAVAPEIFELGADNGKNKVREPYETETSESRSTGIIPEDLYEKAKQAADNCPVEAIEILPLGEDE